MADRASKGSLAGHEVNRSLPLVTAVESSSRVRMGELPAGSETTAWAWGTRELLATAPVFSLSVSSNVSL
jgi:hypothetical protein